MNELKEILKDASWLKRKENIYSFLEPGFERKLNMFLEVFEKIREDEGRRMHDVNILKKLPGSSFSFDWLFRKKSLEIVREILAGKKNLSVLEIGAWQGWLSKEIAAMEHRLVAIDYFSDELDGLNTVKFHHPKWTALQCDLADPDIFNCKFDLIIMNHCLPYQTSPVDYAEKLTEMIKTGGMVILLGVPFFQNCEPKKRALNKMKMHYQEKYGLEIFIHPVKGCLNSGDRKKLEDIGFVFHSYPGLWKQKIAAYLYASKPSYEFGIYQKK